MKYQFSIFPVLIFLFYRRSTSLLNTSSLDSRVPHCSLSSGFSIPLRHSSIKVFSWIHPTACLFLVNNRAAARTILTMDIAHFHDQLKRDPHRCLPLVLYCTSFCFVFFPYSTGSFLNCPSSVKSLTPSSPCHFQQDNFCFTLIMANIYIELMLNTVRWLYAYYLLNSLQKPIKVNVCLLSSEKQGTNMLNNLP